MNARLFASTLLVGMCFCGSVYAQSPENLVSKKSTSLARKYLRPSLTRLYITDGSQDAALAAAQLKQVVDEKFYYNAVLRTDYVMNGIPADKKKRATKVNEFIQTLLKEEKVSNQIIHNWFPTDEQGNLSIDQLVKRGEYAATDNDVLKSEASKRNSALNELGEQLIDRSYIVAYVIMDAPDNNKGGEPTHYVRVIPYIYKLNFNDETRTTFYNENYTPEGIDKMDFPTQFVMNAKSGVLTQDAENDYEDIMNLTRKVSDFQVKSPIVKTHPIQANIGRKEGVRPDKRFSVMEMRADENDPSKTYAKRVATVRASRDVVDNRGVATGKTEGLTRFFQTKGRQLRPGQTLVENPDLGITIVPEFSIAEASLSVEYRVGQWFNVPGFLVYLKAAMPFDTSMGFMKISSYDKDGEIKNFQLFEGAIGLAKEFNFAGNFVLTPSLEGGAVFAPDAKKIDWDNGTYEDKNANLKTYKVGAAVKLGYYLTRNIQLYVNAGYNYWIKSDDFENYQALWIYNNEKDKVQKFQPLSLGAGLKIGF